MGSRSPTKGSRSASCLQQHIVLDRFSAVDVKLGSVCAVDIKLGSVCILTMTDCATGLHTHALRQHNVFDRFSPSVCS